MVIGYFFFVFYVYFFFVWYLERDYVLEEEWLFEVIIEIYVFLI